MLGLFVQTGPGKPPLPHQAELTGVTVDGDSIDMSSTLYLFHIALRWLSLHYIDYEYLLFKPLTSHHLENKGQISSSVGLVHLIPPSFRV